MKNLLVSLALATALMGLLGPPSAHAATDPFNDGFSGSTLNTAVWTGQTGRVGGLCTSAHNAVVSGGLLRMTVRRGTTTDCPWVGARLVTAGKRYFDYGPLRARVKWNPAPGFWGGFVQLGKPSGGRRLADGEIDVEVRNGSLHYRLWSVDSAGKRCGIPIDKANHSLDRWHTFSVNRQATYTAFLLDGVKQATVTKSQMLAKGCTWPFTRRFSLVLSARAGGWGGTPDPARFPVTTLVDWVHR